MSSGCLYIYIYHIYTKGYSESTEPIDAVNILPLARFEPTTSATFRDRPGSLLSRGGDCVVVCVQYSQCFDLFQNGVERKAEVKVPRVLALGIRVQCFYMQRQTMQLTVPGRRF